MTPGYYIYYRIDAARAAQAKAAVEELQREVLRRTGVRGRLMQRRDDPSTWMEIYEDIRDEQAFQAALTEALERQGFSGVLGKGARRVTEAFVPF